MEPPRPPGRTDRRRTFCKGFFHGDSDRKRRTVHKPRISTRRVKIPRRNLSLFTTFSQKVVLLTEYSVEFKFSAPYFGLTFVSLKFQVKNQILFFVKAPFRLRLSRSTTAIRAARTTRPDPTGMLSRSSTYYEGEKLAFLSLNR